MVKAMLPSVTRIADDLIDSFIVKRECDFIDAFAFPLPGLVIAEQIGLDSNAISTFKRWSDGMLAPAMGLLVDEASAQHYAEVEAEAQHYLAALFEERRANPTDDARAPEPNEPAHHRWVYDDCGLHRQHDAAPP
jgi:cytochrome P450